MPRPPQDDAPRRRRGAKVLRGVAFGIAVVLGAVAVFLIVTGTTQKRIEIGVLAGLWGLLLAAYSVFGTRHPHRVVIHHEPVPGQELDLRALGALDTRESAEARRAYEYRLEEMLRRQIQAAMAAEVASLRAEVAALRSEFLETVGGQLRLERIETTRLIGSNLEALQHQVRQAAGAHQPAELSSFSVPTMSSYLDVAADDDILSDRPGDTVIDVTPEPERPLAPAPAPAPPVVHPPWEGPPLRVPPPYAPSAPLPYVPPPVAPAASGRLPYLPAASAPVAPPAAPPVAPPAAMPVGSVLSAPLPYVPPATPAPSAPAAPAPRAHSALSAPLPYVPAPERPAPAAPAPAPAPVPAPVAASGPVPLIPPAPPAAPPAAPAAPAAPARSADPFADLPRLTRFVDIEPEPAHTAPPIPAINGYAGRRRTDEFGALPVPQPAPATPILTTPVNGNGNVNGARPNGASPAPSGGRRRRDDGDDNDMLARILAREGVSGS